MSEKHISKLINGEVLLTEETAFRLEMVLGVPCRFWMNMEAIYREKLLLANEENELDAEIQQSRLYPHAEMSRNGWVPSTANPVEKVRNLRKFFEISRLNLLVEQDFDVPIACRRLSHTKKSDISLLVMAQEARRESREIQTNRINARALLGKLGKIREMTVQRPEKFCSNMKKELALCGISLVFLPHLSGSGLHGISFLDRDKVVLGITARGRDADKFWFSLFHELAHIVLGHISRSCVISESEELEADKWARDILIPTEQFNAFADKRVFSHESISCFAKAMNIDAGIVVGCLQRESYIPYSAFNDMKTKYMID